MTEYSTPLGDIQIDTDSNTISSQIFSLVVNELKNNYKFLKLTKSADLAEHSLEMHCNFYLYIKYL